MVLVKGCEKPGASHRRGHRLRVIFVSGIAVMQIRRDEKEWEGNKKKEAGLKASAQLATSSLMKAAAAIQ